MGAREVTLPRFATGLIAGVVFGSAACLGPKGESGLRAEEQARANGNRVTIAGTAGDQVLGRIYQVRKHDQNGAPVLDIVVSLSDGSRSSLVISPWPLGPLTCAPAECGIEVERMQNPDGPEARVKISRKGRVVAMAATQSRLRALPGAAPFKLLVPSARKAQGQRIGIDLRVGETLIERGKTSRIIIAGQGIVSAEKQSCEMHLIDASVAAEGRPGIAEESAAFMADWVLNCAG